MFQINNFKIRLPNIGYTCYERGISRGQNNSDFPFLMIKNASRHIFLMKHISKLIKIGVKKCARNYYANQTYDLGRRCISW